MSDRKQINFTIVPDETADLPRTYANFCAISHTPFDFTLAFCEVLPLSEKDIHAAEADHIVRAPVRAKIVVPLQVVPNLIAALQEHMRVYSESTGNQLGQGSGSLRRFWPSRALQSSDAEGHDCGEEDTRAGEDRGRDPPHHGPARDAAPERRHRAAFLERL